MRFVAIARDANSNLATGLSHIPLRRQQNTVSTESQVELAVEAGAALAAAQESPVPVIHTTVHGHVTVRPDAIGAHFLKTVLAPGVAIHSIRHTCATPLMDVIGQNRPNRPGFPGEQLPSPLLCRVLLSCTSNQLWR